MAEARVKHSSQNILNWSFDEEYRTLVIQEFKTPYAVKVTTSGTDTYVAKAPVGSSQASAVWQVKKIATATGVVITWADGGNFSQVASDLTALTYT